MIRWPEYLVDDIARRRSVIFLGAGVSANSVNDAQRKPRMWKEFLDSCVQQIRPNRHIKKLIKDNDYLTACEVIKKDLGDRAFHQLLRNEYLIPAYRPADIHETIFRLDSRIVATPNFDKIYETYANAQAHATIVVKNHYDDDVTSAIREDRYIILKIHGTIDTPGNMIFTRSEYAKARSSYSSFYAMLEALFLTHTFLFVGCGINDPDIRLLLEDALYKHKSTRQHVMLLPGGALHKSVVGIVQDTMNLNILKYSSINNHAELLDSLNTLVALVDAKRDDIITFRNW